MIALRFPKRRDTITVAAKKSFLNIIINRVKYLGLWHSEASNKVEAVCGYLVSCHWRGFCISQTELILSSVHLLSFSY